MIVIWVRWIELNRVYSTLFSFIPTPLFSTPYATTQQNKRKRKENEDIKGG